MNQVISPTGILVHTPGPFLPHGGPFAPHQGPLTAHLPHGELPPLGYSGCEVRLGNWGRGLCVEKRASGPYCARLDRQITRQAQARRANTLPFVRIPEVYDTQWTLDGGFMARMEYLLFPDCLRSFATVSRPQIDHTVQLLITYVEANIAASPLQEILRARFCDKLDQIEATLARTDQLTSYRGLIQSVRRRLPTRALVLPIGRAHGDLTLSNVMVSSDGSQLGLLDFLDGYLDSPLVDIAKLRQDTQFHWSLEIIEGPVDRPRVVPILRYMDRMLLAHFERYEWVRRHLDLIQAINLLRIAPYVSASPGPGLRSRRARELLIHAITSLGF